MTAFERFEDAICKESHEHSPIKVKQGKLRYIITRNRLNSLFDYYRPLFFEKDYISFPFRENDLSAWLVVLRYHFKLWIEFDSSPSFLNIYKNFPKVYVVTKEVNKENHWYLEETISVGTILYLAKDNYGVVNWLKGIPLSKSVKGENDTYFQINYDYIKRFDNNKNIKLFLKK